MLVAIRVADTCKAFSSTVVGTSPRSNPALVGGISTLVLASVLSAGRVLGAAPAAKLPITIELDGCEAINERELLDLLAIECKTLGIDGSVPAEHVRVECRESRAFVTLRGPSDEGAPLSARLDMSATMPAARSRLLALSVSELVVAARSRVIDPSGTKADQVHVASTESLTVASGVDQRDPFRTGIFAAGSVRRVGKPGTWLAGGALGIESEVVHHLSATLEGAGEFGSTQTELARVKWTSLSVAGTVRVAGDLGKLSFAAGPGFRVGRLWLDAEPEPTTAATTARGGRVGGLWAGPLLAGRVRYELAPRVFAYVNVETGIVTSPVLGGVSDGRGLIDASGGWVLLALGAGLPF